MKKFIFIQVFISLLVIYILFSCNNKGKAPDRTIRQDLMNQVDGFAILCGKLQHLVVSDSVSDIQIQNLFLELRRSYKKMEWAAEYFDPATTRLVNGPPVVEVESSGQIIEPAGLQIIESYLFPNYDSTRKKLLIGQLNQLIPNCDIYKTRFKNAGNYDAQVFDAVKLEIFRIMTLGITGFDNPLTQKSMQESSLALQGIQGVMAYYNNNGDANRLITKLKEASKYLSAHSDFNSFNRMEFITSYCNQMTILISDLQEKLKIPGIPNNRLLNQDAKTLFDSNAFNVNAYAPDHSSFISDDKIGLGKKLFGDAILSGTGKRSCLSCHQPGKAFTDGLIKNTVIQKNELLGRNTPTLINAALQPALFYDLRVKTLEDQSHSVVQSSKEMHGSMTVFVTRLWQDKKYRQMFLAAFPYEDKTRIDTFEVMNAIGSYIRSLVFLNSRFDEYMRGNKTAMHVDEINGFNLFMGKAKCATCHYMPLFNGTFPPRFIKIESEVIGVPKDNGKNEIDADPGRFDVIHIQSFRHAFKTSTVRNAALTAPYMHNGVFSTLEQVVDFYNKGGGLGLGMKLDNQTLPFEKLDLSEKEIKDIVGFIKSLDSKMKVE